MTGYTPLLRQQGAIGTREICNRASTVRVKKVEGKQPTFLTKLYGLLEQPEYQHIIRWDNSGETIIIERPDELANKILPVVYRQSRFASFSRQLNIYGFNRKISLRHIERDICDPDASSWSHPFLRRDSSQEAILSFKRRVPPRPTQAQRRRMSQRREGLSRTGSTSDSSPVFRSPPDIPRAFLPELMGQAGSTNPPSPQPYDWQDPFDTTSFVPLEVEYGSLSQPISLKYPPFVDTRQAHGQREFNRSFAVLPKTLRSLDSVPQSAPPNTESYPVPVRVTQQHARTRSVQGEPPSAMLLPTTSPYDSPGVLGEDIRSHRLGLARNKDEIDLPLDQRVHPIRHWDIASKPYSGRLYHSLPGAVSAQAFTGYITGLPSASQSLSFGASGDGTISPGMLQSSFPLNTVEARTIAPLVSPPSLGLGTLTRPKSIGQIRHERRTLTASPYSPKPRAPPLLFSGSLRPICSRGNSEAPPALQGLGLTLENEDVETTRQDRECLPSASIRLADADPFEGILGVACEQT
ncbi:hypothetical protein IAU60_002442 [Kwoniella sp. DSM 27419]